MFATVSINWKKQSLICDIGEKIKCNICQYNFRGFFCYSFAIVILILITKTAYPDHYVSL